MITIVDIIQNTSSTNQIKLQKQISFTSTDGINKCQQCNKQFKKKNKLFRHINQTHLNIKNYKCDACNKQFKRNYHLIRHQLSHTNLKSFQCNLCIMAFNYKHHVDRHIKLVHNNQLYKCEQCKEEFRKKKSLNKHIKLHGQNIPTNEQIPKIKKIKKRKQREVYVCTFQQCLSSFQKLYLLKRHQVKSHNKELQNFQKCNEDSTKYNKQDIFLEN